MEKISTTGVRLDELLKEKNWRQIDLYKNAKTYCDELGTQISTGNISEYLSEKFEPSELKLKILAKVLGVNELWLKGYNVPKNPEYSYIDYKDPDSISKYFETFISIDENNLDINTINYISYTLQRKKLISKDNDFTKKSKNEIKKFLTDNKWKLIDNKIFIEIKKSNKL